MGTGWAQEKERVVRVGTIPEQMRFDVDWIGTVPGERLVIELVNTCRMQHNLVICKPGKEVTMKVAQEAWKLGAEAVEKEYVPDHPSVLAASPVVGPGESKRFLYVTPKEKGDYPFVCTLPGHALTMTGVLHVGEPGDKRPARLTPEKNPESAIGRARQKMKRFQHLMDTGPLFAGVFTAGSARMVDGAELKLGSTNRGLAVRVGKHQEAAILFDPELMRVAAGWTGEFVGFRPGRADEHAEYRVHIGGEVHHLLGEGTGWASLDGQWGDPRAQGLGPLSPHRASYLGHYRAGERVVFRYRVNGVDVLESPWFLPGEKAGEGIFVRTLRVGASSRPLRLRLASSTKVRAAVSESSEVTLADVKGFHEVTISARDKAITFTAGVSRGEIAGPLGPTLDLDQLVVSGNAGQVGPPVITHGSLGTGDGPYVVDTLTLPYENYWNALLYTSGLDFFANGDIAVCTSHGDVWRVSGVDDHLHQLTWRRMASGLANLLGLRIVDDTVFVIGLHGLIRLHDFDRDGAADFYENFNADWDVSQTHHRFTTDLQTDAAGNFYFVKCTEHGRTRHDGAVIKVSRDGARMELYATGIRNSNGMGMGPNDLLSFSKQQGDWIPSGGINVVERGKFYGYADSYRGQGAPKSFAPPMVWIPQGVDSSCGGQAWIPRDGRWGPLGGKMIHLSYGKCRLFLVLPEKAGDIYQGGVVEFPDIAFRSGAMRARFRSQDGQLYVCGLRGWQTSGEMPGCLQRVRYTGKPVLLPNGLTVEADGVRLSFLQPLDRAQASEPARYRVQQWNYRWWKNYGSPPFKVSNPEEQGSDVAVVDSVAVAADGRSVLLRIPKLQPVMQMSLAYDLTAADGRKLKGTVYNTIHRVPERGN